MENIISNDLDPILYKVDSILCENFEFKKEIYSKDLVSEANIFINFGINFEKQLVFPKIRFEYRIRGNDELYFTFSFKTEMYFDINNWQKVYHDDCLTLEIDFIKSIFANIIEIMRGYLIAKMEDEDFKLYLPPIDLDNLITRDFTVKQGN